MADFAYTEGPTPTFDEGWQRYISAELAKISQSSRVMQETLRQMETNPVVVTKAGAVVLADVPLGTWQIINDTVGATTKLYANIGGVLKSVALT